MDNRSKDSDTEVTQQIDFIYYGKIPVDIAFMTCGLVQKLDDNQISCAGFVDNLDYGTLMDVFPEDDCTDLNQLGACMKKAICFLSELLLMQTYIQNIVMVFCSLVNP